MNKERAAAEPVLFTPDELTLLGDEQFFRAKARIMTKMKAVWKGSTRACSASSRA